MTSNDYTLSIVIPCYNERDHIEQIVRRVLEVPIERKEIIVVDDKSTDGSSEIIDRLIAPLVAQVIHHEKNGGKGAALRTGFAHATGDIVIVQDADMEYDPMDYPVICEVIASGRAKVCYGSRFLEKAGRVEKEYRANHIANGFLTRFSNLFTHQHLTDMETCYKAFRREVIQQIEIVENRFGFEPEITSKITKMGIPIKEVPISYHPRTVKEGKKIGFRDGLRAIYCILKYH